MGHDTRILATFFSLLRRCFPLLTSSLGTNVIDHNSLGPGLIVQQFIEATAFVDYFSCQQVFGDHPDPPLHQTPAWVVQPEIPPSFGWSFRCPFKLRNHVDRITWEAFVYLQGPCWVLSQHMKLLFSSHLFKRKNLPISNSQSFKPWIWGSMQPKDGCEQAEGLVHWVTPLNKLRLPGLDCVNGLV